MHKIPALVAAVAVASVVGAVLAGPAGAIGDDLARCARTSASYTKFQECIQSEYKAQRGRGLLGACAEAPNAPGCE